MHRGVRRTVAAGSALVLFAALTACSTTVDGKGVALGGSTSARTSTGSNPTGFPTDTESVTPSGGASGSLTATPNAGGGFLVTYPDGHFKAVFPEEPQSQSQPGNIGPVSFTVYIATVPNSALAASEDFTPHIDPSGYDETLRAAVSSFTSSSGLTLQSQQATTFQGHKARAAELTSAGGDTFDVTVFMYSGERLYILFGTKGDVFDTLAQSFQALA